MVQAKHKGSALLTALFIMTLVAIVATAMTTRLQLDIYRTRLIINHDKLYLAAQAVTFWSLTELNNTNRRFSTVNKLGMVAQLPPNLEHIYNQVTLGGGIYDLQSRFNLNNILEKKSMASFINLVKIVFPKSNDTDTTNLVLAVKDWVSNYDLSRGTDNYTSYYLSQNPPYFPSRQIMQSSSEFRLVKDVSPQIFLALEPFITVLPDTTSVNLNTAPKEVIMALGNGVTEAHANELIMSRGEEGIKDIKDVSEILKKIDVPDDQTTLESTYYLTVAYASNEDFNIVVYTLIKRSKDDQKKLSVSVIRETINGF